MKDLSKESIPKLLFKYSVPAIIGMLVNALYNIVDRIFIGNIPGIGPLAITGVGITMPIMTIILAFGMLVGIGANTNISIKLGQKKKEEAENIIGNAISLSVIIGIIITCIGLIFSDAILNAFGASENSIIYAKPYLNIILLGSVFTILSMAFNNMIRGDGNPKQSAIIITSGCVINIVLDAVFIFVFNMGIIGAALATIIAQAITALWGLFYFVNGKSNLHFKKSTLKLDKKIVKLIFSIGIAPFLMQIATSAIQVINNNALKTYGGDLAIGAMATVSSITLLFLMPSFGLVQGMQPIIGFNHGAKEYERAKETFKLSLIASSVFFIAGFLFIQMCPQILVGLFNKDETLMAITINGLRKYALALPIVGLPIIGTNFLQSIGNAKVSIFLSLLRQVIILIPMIIILPNFLGLDGVWFAQPISDLISTIITAIFIIKTLKTYGK